MVTRRTFLAAGGLTLAGLSAPTVLRAARPVEIQMRATARGEEVWFDPIGVWVAPGQTVRWVLHHDVHTTTAYHPTNDQHSLRIPEEAEPWDSGILTRPGQSFEVKLTVPGVYDYFCLPHEAGGMVGRIVVGEPGTGPGTRSFDWYVGRTGADAWRAVPDAARRSFPPVDRIVREKVVRIAAT